MGKGLGKFLGMVYWRNWWEYYSISWGKILEQFLGCFFGASSVESPTPRETVSNHSIFDLLANNFGNWRSNTDQRYSLGCFFGASEIENLTPGELFGCFFRASLVENFTPGETVSDTCAWLCALSPRGGAQQPVVLRTLDAPHDGFDALRASAARRRWQVKEDIGYFYSLSWPLEMFW